MQERPWDMLTKLLRSAHNELTYYITNLETNSIAMGTFPDQLKCAELRPLYKKEDNMNKDNFRSVSILTGISKLYESVRIVLSIIQWSD